MTREEGKAIWERVKANHTKLQACPRHVFEPPVAEPGAPWRKHARCVKCGGEIDAIAYHWYMRGLQDGRA